MLSDVTPFFSGFGGASQSPAIAQAFAHAALDPAGACKQPAAGVVDLAVSLTSPASLTPGTPANYLLRVANPGVVASTAIHGDPHIADGCDRDRYFACWLHLQFRKHHRDVSVARPVSCPELQLNDPGGGRRRCGGATPSRRCRPRPAKSTQPTTMRLWRSPLAPRRLHRPPCQRWMSGRCFRWAACCRWWLRAAVAKTEAKPPSVAGLVGSACEP